MKEHIIYPTFKSAQQLYSNYSTIETSSVLYEKLNEFIDASFISTMVGDNIHEIYNKIILKYYPNEICIKSNFINSVLSKGKTHVTIFELPVGSSRADLCKINGKSIAYEIKTDLDNLNRMDKQIIDYCEIFDEVYIICSQTNCSNIIDLAPIFCGIYSYTQSRNGQYKFKLVRNAIPQNQTNPQKQLSLFRKKELKSNFKLDSSLKSRDEITDFILNNYSQNEINKRFKAALKSRFQNQWTFFKQNYNEMCEIDYQWFYKNQIDPSRIYK